MTSQFVKGLQILCKASNRSLDGITCDIYLEHIIGREGDYLNALRKFYKENIGRPRLPSLDELDELAFGKKLKKADVASLSVAEYINLVRRFGRYESKKVKEIVGPDFFNSMNRIKNYESLCNANEFETNDFKKDAKIALERDAEIGIVDPSCKFMATVGAIYNEKIEDRTSAIANYLLPPPEPPQTNEEEEIYEVAPPSKQLTPDELRSGLNEILEGITQPVKNGNLLQSLTDYIKKIEN